MQVTIAIVTFNNESTLNECLKSVFAQTVPFNLLIIDNGSIDKTLNIISSYKDAVVICNKKNNGYAGGNNQAISWVKKNKGDYLLIINPDTILFPNVLKELIIAAVKYDNQGIFGPVIYADKQKKRVWSTGGILDAKRYSAKLLRHAEFISASKNRKILKNHAYRPACRTVRQAGVQDDRIDFISGTCLLMPRKLLVTGLQFFEKYFMYYEDVEFSRKAYQLGFCPKVVENAHIIHLESSEVDTFIETKNYYLARNHLLFVERNAPFGVKLHELARIPKTVLEHLINNDNGALLGIKDYFLRRFGFLTSLS